uniref:Uncharacterized protein n=1 Tax=Rhizophora mucronata TaxID=61149 RepID=A0A2P2PUH5_RHIMU
MMYRGEWVNNIMESSPLLLVMITLNLLVFKCTIQMGILGPLSYCRLYTDFSVLVVLH